MPNIELLNVDCMEYIECVGAITEIAKRLEKLA